MYFNNSSLICIGIDVHKDTYSYCTFIENFNSNENEKYHFETTSKANTKSVFSYIDKVKKEIATTGYEPKLKIGYEAGPTGFGLQRALVERGYDCSVMAPTSIYEKKGGNIVKTDRKDARKLSSILSYGLFSKVEPPTKENEAARDYMRARQSTKHSLKQAKQKLKSFLLSKDIRFEGKDNWSMKHMTWLRGLKFDYKASQLAFESYLYELTRLEQKLEEMDRYIEEMAQEEDYKENVSKLRCLAGIETHTAMTILTEIGDYTRFASPGQLAAFLGLVPGQHSSGGTKQMKGITKAGNSAVRKVLVESANAIVKTNIYGKSKRLKARQQGMPNSIIDYADRGTKRVKRKIMKLREMGKNTNVAKIAGARELTCFIWGMLNNRID